MATKQKLILGTFVSVMACAGASVVLMPTYSSLGKARREQIANGDLNKPTKEAPGSVRRCGACPDHAHPCAGANSRFR